jgi:replicative DNA helicase
MTKRKLEHLFSVESEEAVLGSVIIQPSVFPTLNLQPRDFYIQRHQLIWRAFQDLFINDRKIDYLSVVEQLQANGDLVEVGGSAYITKIVNRVPSSLHADTYAQTIRDFAHRRDIVEACNSVVVNAWSADTDIEQEQAVLMQALIDSARVSSGAVPIREWMEAGVDELEDAAKNPVDMAGLPTGFRDLDKITEGITPGVVLIGGKPGIGKTIFVQQICENLGERNYPGALYSSEMSQDNMTKRILSSHTGLRISDMRRGMIPDDAWDGIFNTAGQISDYPISVSDSNAWTVSSLRADLTRLKYEQDIKWFAFDYLELIRDQYGDSQAERSAYIGRHLTYICKELDLVGFVVQKLTKAGFDGVPDLQHFGGGSDLQYDVSLALMLMEHIPEHENDEPSPNVRTGLVRKGRFLETTDRIFHLYKHPDKPRFGDMFPEKEAPNGF